MPYKEFRHATSLNSIYFQTLHAILHRFMTKLANQKIQTRKVHEFTSSQTMHAQIMKGPVTRMLSHPVKTSDDFYSAHMSKQELVPVHQITMSIFE